VVVAISAFSFRFPGLVLLREEQADRIALLSAAAAAGSGAAGTDRFITPPQTSCARCQEAAAILHCLRAIQCSRPEAKKPRGPEKEIPRDRLNMRGEGNKNSAGCPFDGKAALRGG
jgi:hypothetical protein